MKAKGYILSVAFLNLILQWKVGVAENLVFESKLTKTEHTNRKKTSAANDLVLKYIERKSKSVTVHPKLLAKWERKLKAFNSISGRGRDKHAGHSIGRGINDSTILKPNASHEKDALKKNSDGSIYIDFLENVLISTSEHLESSTAITLSAVSSTNRSDVTTNSLESTKIVTATEQPHSSESLGRAESKGKATTENRLSKSTTVDDISEKQKNAVTLPTDASSSKATRNTAKEKLKILIDFLEDNDTIFSHFSTTTPNTVANTKPTDPPRKSENRSLSKSNVITESADSQSTTIDGISERQKRTNAVTDTSSSSEASITTTPNTVTNPMSTDAPRKREVTTENTVLQTTTTDRTSGQPKGNISVTLPIEIISSSPKTASNSSNDKIRIKIDLAEKHANLAGLVRGLNGASLTQSVHVDATGNTTTENYSKTKSVSKNKLSASNNDNIYIDFYQAIIVTSSSSSQHAKSSTTETNALSTTSKPSVVSNTLENTKIKVTERPELTVYASISATSTSKQKFVVDPNEKVTTENIPPKSTTADDIVNGNPKGNDLVIRTGDSSSKPASGTNKEKVRILIDFPNNDSASSDNFSTTTSLPEPKVNTKPANATENYVNLTTRLVASTTSLPYSKNTSNVIYLDVITQEPFKSTTAKTLENTGVSNISFSVKTISETVAITSSTMESNAAGIRSSAKYISTTPASDSHSHSSPTIPRNFTDSLITDTFSIKSISTSETPDSSTTGHTQQQKTTESPSSSSRPPSTTPNFIIEYFTFSRGPPDGEEERHTFVDDYEVYREHRWIDYDCCL